MVRQLNIRQQTEAREESFSPHAAKSVSSRGRLKPEAPDAIRAAFQRDRDRIIHSKAFRRLKHKTQVFIAPLGDHYVTRLTHTLEVAQIARTISRALSLNEDLTEAIALGHDLGHTPFGHVGEDVLDELSTQGFRHAEQSLRVVDLLENEGRGLNLAWEVRDGILNHSKSVARLGDGGGEPETLEGEVCKLADAIAYINHDIGDAVRAGIISEGDLPLSAVRVLGISHSQRINTMVSDVIEHSWAASGFVSAPAKASIRMSPEVLEAANILRDFLFERVYNLRSALEEAEKARDVIRRLYAYFQRNPEGLPAEYRLVSNDVERRVVDYIAGMTDQYAFRMAEEVAQKE
ncbi:deoxyguanosinetriphosphate triphosphohydrolase [Chloroflexota bacterium]